MFGSDRRCFCVRRFVFDGFYLFLKTPHRRGTQFHADKLSWFVLNFHLDPKLLIKTMSNICPYLERILCIWYIWSCTYIRSCIGTYICTEPTRVPLVLCLHTLLHMHLGDRQSIRKTNNREQIYTESDTLWFCVFFFGVFFVISHIQQYRSWQKKHPI